VNAADAREAEAIEMGELDQELDDLGAEFDMDDDALVSMISNLISELIEECERIIRIYLFIDGGTNETAAKGSAAFAYDKCLQYLGMEDCRR
jgi:hypothetical protein